MTSPLPEPFAWLFEGPQGLRQWSKAEDFVKPVLDLHKRMAQEQPGYTLTPLYAHPVQVVPSDEEIIALWQKAHAMPIPFARMLLHPVQEVELPTADTVYSAQRAGEDLPPALSASPIRACPVPLPMPDRTLYGPNRTVDGHFYSAASMRLNGQRCYANGLEQAQPQVALTDAQIEPLFRQVQANISGGGHDEWFWFAAGVELGEKAHGIVGATEPIRPADNEVVPPNGNESPKDQR